jgi:hypothetical protein
VLLEHFQVGAELRELFAVDGKEKVEDEESRPNTEVSQSHDFTSYVGIVVDEKPLQAFVAADDALDFLWGYRRLAAINDRVLE